MSDNTVQDRELERTGRRLARPGWPFVALAAVLTVIGVILLIVTSGVIWVLGIVLIAFAGPPAVIGIALVSTAAGYSTGIVAARRLGAKLASFIGMAEILFAVSYAWILLGQLPSATQFAGGALILAGVTLVKIDES